MDHTFLLPGSKSISARAITANALGGGKSRIHNIADCDDADRLAAAFAMLSHKVTTEVNIGSGAAPMRFFIAAAASMPGAEVVVSCDPQLARRPIAPLLCSLEMLGAAVESLPDGRIRVVGKRLKGGDVFVNNSVSSQFVSALMLAAPCWESGGVIRTSDGRGVSRPYIDMTAAVMRDFGAKVEINEEMIIVEPGGYTPPSDFCVESDWTAASYVFEAVAISGLSRRPIPTAFIPNLSNPRATRQGDAICALLFDRFVESFFDENSARLKVRTDADKSFYEANLIDAPDLAPALAATLCALQVPFRLGGLAHLRVKESDRIGALCSQLAACGFEIYSGDDFLASEALPPRFPNRRITIDTFGDHRIAMSMSLLDGVLPGGLEIDRPEVVAKSFSGFWSLFPFGD